MTLRGFRLGLIASEPSADVLAASLVSDLRERGFEGQIAAVNGVDLERTGARELERVESFSVHGINSIIRHYPRLMRAKRRLLSRLRDFQPHAVIGVDGYYLSRPILSEMKEEGVATAQYVSPSAWNRRRHRIQELGRAADKLWCLFSFEPSHYKDSGLDAVYVGHPLLQSPTGQHRAKSIIPGLQDDAPLLAIAPGSRPQEIRRHVPFMLKMAERLKQEIPRLQVCMSVMPGQTEALVRKMCAACGHGDIPMSEDLDVLCSVADFGIIKSGTATLVAFRHQLPMVVMYRSFETVVIGLTPGKRRMLFALPNLLSQRMLVPQLISLDNLETSTNVTLGVWQQRDAIRRDLKAAYDSETKPAIRLADDVMAWLMDVNARST